MSSLRKGDEDLHYSDNSHRWIAPPDVEQSLWEAGLRAHLNRHGNTMGGSATNHRPVQHRPVRSEGITIRAKHEDTRRACRI
jgi:hypothetical protein